MKSVRLPGRRHRLGELTSFSMKSGALDIRSEARSPSYNRWSLLYAEYGVILERFSGIIESVRR
jgi:hypothetical protein